MHCADLNHSCRLVEVMVPGDQKHLMATKGGGRLQIAERLWSHESKPDAPRFSAEDVRKSKPRQVRSFHSLVRRVATVAYFNPGLDLFFRGQEREYLNRHGATTLLPTMYRNLPGKRAADPILDSRFNALELASQLLFDAFEQRKLFGARKIGQYPELCWAVLQHYEVCPTPLIDFTTSLRVACSFALANGGTSGVLYVVGLPRTHASISFNVDDELVNLKLQAACPPKAIRPYFQEGYLAGTLPWVKDHSRAARTDAGRRLVAKFKLSGAGFWHGTTGPISKNDLLPEKDPMLRICESIRRKISKAAQSAEQPVDAAAQRSS